MLENIKDKVIDIKNRVMKKKDKIIERVKTRRFLRYDRFEREDVLSEIAKPFPGKEYLVVEDIEDLY